MIDLRILSYVLQSPWAMLPDQLALMCSIIARHAAGRAADADTMARVQASAEARSARRDVAVSKGGGAIAVLPMYGIVAQRGGGVDDVSGPGVMSTERFAQAFRAAIQDPNVGGVLIDIDSPGGSVYGVQELANEIVSSRGSKPVYGIANSLAASAAYWLGSACEQLFITPGGEVGSIGVCMAHKNLARMLEAEGVDVTLISAGKYKVEGNPYGPLSDEARSYMQSRVDQYYTAFTRCVARGRGASVDDVRKNMGQGRVFSATDAKTAGMVDDVETFDGALKRLASAMRKTKAAASADVQPLDRVAHSRRLLALAEQT